MQEYPKSPHAAETRVSYGNAVWTARPSELQLLGVSSAHFPLCTAYYLPCLQFLNTLISHALFESSFKKSLNFCFLVQCRLQHWITTRELSLWVMAKFWTMTMFWLLLEESEWFLLHSFTRVLFPSLTTSVDLPAALSCFLFPVVILLVVLPLGVCPCLFLLLSVCRPEVCVHYPSV